MGKPATVSARGAGPALHRARAGPVPEWLAQADRALADAAFRVRVIAASTPLNFRAELGRLADAWDRGRSECPRFVYAPPADHRALIVALGRLADLLEPEGPIGPLYAGRARELCDEATIASSVGTDAFWPAARRRFASRDGFDAQADALSSRWLDPAFVGGAEGGDADAAPHSSETVRSDDERDPRSLLSRLREEIGREKLPLRVLVSRDLASLAATGDGAVQVVAGRPLTLRDVERTVLHEIDGHVRPRLAAASAPLGIFALGTARGSDDQEGRALALERASGFLDAGRRRELALRHVAARSVEQGEDFTETTSRLAKHELGSFELVRIACRAHRGGGLAREAVYLPALLRTEAAAADGEIDGMMRLGRVAVDAAPVLHAWLTSGAEARER